MESIRETLLRVIGALTVAPAGAIADQVRDRYPDITLEDAIRIRDVLTAVITATDMEEVKRLKAEYIALHKELRKRYRKSGQG